ncbi:transposase-like zinc-binding domain-containing protein [Actinomyces urogenitalis]|uniref:transposase-like zinc-binding domain-containing protein n=1 Tax=Actinomyces urogenitalis TaxID=103621 RepID=UPI003C6C407A
MQAARRRSPRARLCPICQTPMKKPGRTAAGAQRWKCSACRSSATVPRPPSPGGVEQAELAEFIAWATSTSPSAPAYQNPPASPPAPVRTPPDVAPPPHPKKTSGPAKAGPDEPARAPRLRR